MKILINKIYIVLLTISLIVSTTIAQNQNKSFTVKKGDELNLSTRMGDITIDTWNKNEVQVDVKNIIDRELDRLKIEQSGSVVKIEFKGRDSDDIEFGVRLSPPHCRQHLFGEPSDTFHVRPIIHDPGKDQRHFRSSERGLTSQVRTKIVGIHTIWDKVY